eukprot:14730470-Ditylum_brightwellii.AAC.1
MAVSEKGEGVDTIASICPLFGTVDTPVGSTVQLLCNSTYAAAYIQRIKEEKKDEEEDEEDRTNTGKRLWKR